MWCNKGNNWGKKWLTWHNLRLEKLSAKPQLLQIVYRRYLYDLMRCACVLGSNLG